MFGKLFEWFVGLFVELLMKWKVTDAILRKLSGFREPKKSFARVMARGATEFLEKEKTNRDLTPDEGAALKSAKELLEKDDIERVIITARLIKERLEQEKTRRTLDSNDKATLKLVTKFLDEKNEKVKLKLFKELLKRGF